MSIESLATTERGISWLVSLPKECLDGLLIIERQLNAMWNSRSCYPVKSKVLIPFHMISLPETTMVIICKEPYGSNDMATGIPVETGNKLVTPSIKVFKSVISRYWSGVTDDNFMHCFYASGILVINASFTSQTIYDKRYSLTCSHFPMWTRFCHPFVKYINAKGIPILALGVEGKGLTRNMAKSDIVFQCSFPRDQGSINEFTVLCSELIERFIFRIQ